MNFEIKGDAEKAEDKVDPILAATAAAQKAHPELNIEQFGAASTGKAVSKMFEDDLKKAETLSLPLTLVILLLAFGALVAAGLPLLLGVTAVMATMGLVAAISQIAPATENLSSVVVLVGLAVGVDYSLFYIRREREERRAGLDEAAALNAAAATSGRAVLVSGFTVMAAMAGMYFTGDNGFASMATGTIVVVGVAMLGSLTVLPALLEARRPRTRAASRSSASAPRSAPSRACGRRARPRPAPPGDRRGALGRRARRAHHPGARHAHRQRGRRRDPEGQPGPQDVRPPDRRVPGREGRAGVVVKADDVTSPEVAGAIKQLEGRALGTKTAIDTTTSSLEGQDGRPGHDPDRRQGHRRRVDDRARQDPRRPRAVDGRQGPRRRGRVGGDVAMTKDYNDMVKANAPIVFAFVLGLAFLLLLTTFRSLVIPVKAIVLNLLSVGAAYGVLKVVFQDGHGEKLLGFESPARSSRGCRCSCS